MIHSCAFQRRFCWILILQGMHLTVHKLCSASLCTLGWGPEERTVFSLHSGILRCVPCKYLSSSRHYSKCFWCSVNPHSNPTVQLGLILIRLPQWGREFILKHWWVAAQDSTSRLAPNSVPFTPNIRQFLPLLWLCPSQPPTALGFICGLVNGEKEKWFGMYNNPEEWRQHKLRPVNCPFFYDENSIFSPLF